MIMSTKTKEAPTSKNGATQTKKQVVKKDEKKATQTQSAATSETKKDEKVVAMKKVSEILQPNAKNRLSRLETLNILADKYNNVSEKYDELTHFMAGNDGTNATMKFSSASNYSFTLRRPELINKILAFVESEFSDVVAKAETELLNYNV